MASGIGTVRLKTPENENDLILTDVLYMPTFPVNLFSGVILYTFGGCICRKTSILRDSQDEVIYNIDISIEGLFLKASSFYIAFSQATAHFTRQEKIKAIRRLWHRRLRHLGHRNVRKTSSMTNGMLGINQFQPEEEHLSCNTCEMAKSRRKVLREQQLRAQHAFDEIHTNVVGPLNPIRKNGHK